MTRLIELLTIPATEIICHQALANAQQALRKLGRFQLDSTDFISTANGLRQAMKKSPVTLDGVIWFNNFAGRLAFALDALHEDYHSALNGDCWCHDTLPYPTVPRPRIEGALMHQLWKRGIKGVAENMGWLEHKYDGVPGWSYPVVNDRGNPVAARWKRAGGVPGPKKYVWLGKRNGALYYFTPRCFQDAAKKKLMYYASGEVDVLTFHAAGAYNVMSSFGEQSIPAPLIPDMEAIGVEQVFIYPDLDNGGDIMRDKMLDIFEGQNVQLVAKELPYALGKRGDVNALWQACGRDKTFFRQIMKALPAYNGKNITPKRPEGWEPPKPKQTNGARRYTSGGSIDWDALREEWSSTVVMPALTSKAASQRKLGKHFQCINPHHPDKNPSARVSTDTGPPIYVCTCGAHGWSTVAAWLGLELFEAWYKGRRASGR